eukprot:scaffold10768_cov90-Alexandrium_tamarense.AAC.1
MTVEHAFHSVCIDSNATSLPYKIPWSMLAYEGRAVAAGLFPRIVDRRRLQKRLNALRLSQVETS